MGEHAPAPEWVETAYGVRAVEMAVHSTATAVATPKPLSAAHLCSWVAELVAGTVFAPDPGIPRFAGAPGSTGMPCTTADRNSTGAPGTAVACRPSSTPAAGEKAVLDMRCAELIDQIRALEELKCAAAGRQAVLATVFDALQRGSQEASGVPKKELGKGVGAQIALARRDSPAKGARHLGLAKVLVAEMPHTLHALLLGRISEWRATILARDTAALSKEDRMAVDEEVAADLGVLEGLNDAALASRVRAAAYRADAAAFVRAHELAARDRNVTCRPAPGGMVYLSGLLPLKGGVGALAALDREAAARRNSGDGRARGQIMADLMVERLIGAADASTIGVEIQLIMTDRTLFDGGAEPAFLPGYGMVPAQEARLVASPAGNGPGSGKAGADGGSRARAEAENPPSPGGKDRGDKNRVWIRRLFTHPVAGDLVGMDSRRRTFPKPMQRFIRARDQVCRTPWCGAPIRHGDHVKSYATAGPTERSNAQGLCERCNQAKEAAGWAFAVIDGPRHTVETTTPTGHIYISTAPPLPGTGGKFGVAVGLPQLVGQRPPENPSGEKGAGRSGPGRPGSVPASASRSGATSRIPSVIGEAAPPYVARSTIRGVWTVPVSALAGPSAANARPDRVRADSVPARRMQRQRNGRERGRLRPQGLPGDGGQGPTAHRGRDPAIWPADNRRPLRGRASAPIRVSGRQRDHPERDWNGLNQKGLNGRGWTGHPGRCLVSRE